MPSLAVLGEEGAKEFQKEYRTKIKDTAGKKETMRASLSREEIKKITAEAGGDRKKAKQLLQQAQAKMKQGSSVIAGRPVPPIYRAQPHAGTCCAPSARAIGRRSRTPAAKQPCPRRWLC